MRKYAIVSKASLIAALALSAFSIGPAPRAQEAPAIPVIVKAQNFFFWKVVLAGANAASRDLGVKILGEGAESEQDVDGQIKLLNQAVATKPGAIVIAPTQYSALGPAVDNAAKQTAVIVIDSNVASLNMKSFIATDNVHAGALAADALAKAISAKYGSASGEVAIVNYLPGAGSVIERSKGFKDELFRHYPQLTVVDERNGDGSKEHSDADVAAVLKNHPNLRGIFASNQIVAEAAGAAVKAGKLAETIKLVGFDSSPDLTALLADGSISGLVVQDPFQMGYEGVKTAYNAAQGHGVLQYIDTGATVITRDTMNSEREKKLLNPPVE
ncbi:substrate-binding domain-containing protein [Methylovirgula sp. 4M-Z18]|uniref:substrate-binding domain-containing protein n=1 Tax=Methylovirgula sp. 4M-Z18 TaxID=2293567 RepID=UPI000E2F09C5|nr:substrate-binding domain-containing protein [Methylovirgula sp. 4M-Z18]RFB75584.1 ABC transporter substrate-binding protein [Methylovirgula sp. 4M-Z18]